MLTAIKGEINDNTIIVGGINTPLTSMDRSSRQKINKETQALNDTLDQMDLIYRGFHPKAAEYTFFSRTWNILQDRSLAGPQSKPRKFKKIEITSSFFSNNDGMKLEINYKKNTVKNTKT